jgi:protein involved in polysaccharide export with SLBB domain
MTSISRCLVVLLALALGFAATSQDRPLRPGDKIRLTCEEEPSLNRDYTLTRDGLLLLNFVGAVEVAGLTPEDAARRVSDQLVAHRILPRATVTIRLLMPELSPVRFAGAVRVAGQTPFVEGMRLSGLLAIAQPTAAANLSEIRIEDATGGTATVDATQTAGDLDLRDPALKPGDFVFIPALERPQEVLVLGGVARPGVTAFEAGMTVRTSIERAGGLTGLGDGARVRLEREAQPARLIDLATPAAGERVQAGDRIVVELRPARRFVLVDGEVRRPGMVELRDGMTLTQAIESAGGALRTARLDRVGVRRGQGRQARTEYHNVERILAGYVGDIPLRPNDAILVGRSAGGRANLLRDLGVALAGLLLIGR